MRTLPFVLLKTQVRMTLADRVGRAAVLARFAGGGTVGCLRTRPRRRFCFEEQ
jgi:hypothetical protein